MRYDPPFHLTNGLIPTVVTVVLLAVFPFVFDASYLRHLLILAMVFAIVAASWDLSFGYGGLLNFAHVALFAVGIYAYGILAKTYGVNPWLAILLSGPIVALVASFMVLPVLRLDGMYVILVTIAFSQILYQIVISQSQITGGTSGMVTLPMLQIDGYRFVKDGKIGYYYTAFVLMVGSVGALFLITRSALGRSIVALRDNKYYAQARGVSEWKTRLATLAVSAFFVGIAGGFYGSYVRVASPDIFGIGSLTLVLSILLVGGLGTIWGPVIAAFIIILLSESMASLGPWRDILIAILIVAVMIFYPGGLWGVVQELRELAQNMRSSMMARYRRGAERAVRQKITGIPEQMIDTAHGRIAVVDIGPSAQHAGPPILFLHGNSACKEAFQNQFAHFRDRHRLIAFDLPGHGVSDNGSPEQTYNVIAYADIAEEILQKLGVERPFVVGWSLGGYNALELTSRNPAAYSGVVTTGTSPLTVAPDDFARGHNAKSHIILAGKQYLTGRETVTLASHATVPKSDKSAFLHRNVRRTDGRARYYMITKLTVVDWPRQMRMLREGDIPVAIMNGDDDPFLNHRYIADLPFGNVWKGHPTDIPGGRHAPFFNQPEVFNRELEAFFEAAVKDRTLRRSA
ncbi:alpha/beta fold hydrolase [uncultured Roseobacter sp.]|uniref:alpha/beta fold hydrolase n=1 Tax=uncultured Roseobacter sp. TaxID=114847 RepID=UPI0026282595|nr:alpha/beta fold hydrolase [uncultured Roseobacter sp.]